MIQNEINHYARLHEIVGPYYCHKTGIYATVEDVTNPEYDPYVIIRIPKNPDTADARKTYIYHLQKEKWYYIDINIRDPLERVIEDIPPEWVVKEVFRREPGVYPPVSVFNKFVMPLINRTWPKLISEEIVSVQPMTRPSSLVFHLTPKYGKKPDVDAT